jgi:hypothetical protein
MRVKSYRVLQRALEEGFACGWQRAHKHTDTPTKAMIEENVIREIGNAIDEVFHFDNEELGVCE